MKKLFRLLTALSLCLALLAIGAAAEDVRYISDLGSGSGLSADAPMNSIADAVRDLADTGGKIVITDVYTLAEPFFEPAHDALITITGGKLNFDHKSYPRYNMGGPLVFEAITLTRTEAGATKKGIIAANFFDLTLGKDVKVADMQLYLAGGHITPVSTQVPRTAPDADPHITVNSGTVESICGFDRGSGSIESLGTSHITVNGGTVKFLYGGTINGCFGTNTEITVNDGTVTTLACSGNSKNPLLGNAKVTVNGGTVNALRTSDTMDGFVGGSAEITVNGGTVKGLTVSNVYGHTTVHYLGGKIETVTCAMSEAAAADADDGKTTLIARKGLRVSEFMEQFTTAAYEDGSAISGAGDAEVATYKTLDKKPEKSTATAAKVYVADAGNGSGLSPDSPISDLKEAFSMLDGVDGTIVLINTVYVGDSNFYEPEHKDHVVITSFDGTTYYDGGLDVGSGRRFYFGGDTTLENTRLTFTKSALFVCRFHNVTFGTGLDMPKFVSGQASAYVLAGYQLPSSEPVPETVGSTLTVESGEYYCVMGYTRGIAEGETFRFKGTQTLNLLGGKIARVYGGTVQANVSDDILLNIDGANITDFIQLGGDQGYHSETATVNIKSGHIKQFDMRNVLKSVDVCWTGGTVDEMVINNCIYNGALLEGPYAEAGEYKDTVYRLEYSGVTPTAAMLALFDSVTEGTPKETTVVKLTIGVPTGYINGEGKPLDAAPIIRNSRTMLPVRFLAEAFGANVGWDGATSTATITAAGVDIRITIGATEAQINGQSVALDSPAFIENSRTYLPVRVIADALGAAVEWDGATSTATLTK